MYLFLNVNQYHRDMLNEDVSILLLFPHYMSFLHMESLNQ